MPRRRRVPGELYLLPVHLERLVHLCLLSVQHGMGVSGAVVQRGKPLLFHADAHFLSGVVAVHPPGVLRPGNSRSSRSYGAGPVHVRDAGLQVIRHTLDALPLEDGTGDTGCYLLLAPCKVNAPPQRPLGRVIGHQVRLPHDQSLYRLLVPQVKANVPSHLLDGVRRIVAVERVDSRRGVVGIGGSRLVGLCVPLRHLVPQSLKSLSPPDLGQPPVVVVLLRPLPPVLDGSDEFLHLLIPLAETLEVGLHGLVQAAPCFLVDGGYAPFQLSKLLISRPVGVIRLPRHPPSPPAPERACGRSPPPPGVSAAPPPPPGSSREDA